MVALGTDDKKLLAAAIESYESRKLHADDRVSFGKDMVAFKRGELTFRELIGSIRKPVGDLKEALIRYYDRSQYRRSFK